MSFDVSKIPTDVCDDEPLSLLLGRRSSKKTTINAVPIIPVKSIDRVSLLNRFGSCFSEVDSASNLAACSYVFVEFGEKMAR